MKALKQKGIFLAVLTSMLLLVSTAFALQPDKDGWFHTGSGIRQKTIVLIKVDVYSISHYAKALPAKNKRAVIDLAADKKFIIKLKRDIASEKLQGALKEGYANNGYTGAANINKFTSAFTGELKEGTVAVIQYNAETKTTTLAGGGKVVSIPNDEAFMKATWSIWFGKFDQPELGDALISKL